MPHPFTHIFGGDGCAGAITPIWSEVLDADGFRPSRKRMIRSIGHRATDKFIYSAGALRDFAPLIAPFVAATPI
jgi:Zn-dependent oligopeptidase